MNWPAIFLGCFVIGFVLSALSFALGAMHAQFHVHAPWGHYVHGHMLHGLHGAHVHAHSIGPINAATVTAFLAWFGGTGYLLTRYSSVWFVLGLGMALGSGLVGASIVFLFLSKVLISEEENMDPADYDMVGVLGRTSIPVREGGTGEIIYSQAGTRRTCGARSEDGVAIAKGVEVVVTRYERGIAYVRLWTEMAGEEPSAADTVP